MKRIIFSCIAIAMTAVCAVAGQKLSLNDVVGGTFRSESMTAVTPLAGGDTYAQISDDGIPSVRVSRRLCSSMPRQLAGRR